MSDYPHLRSFPQSGPAVGHENETQPVGPCEDIAPVATKAGKILYRLNIRGTVLYAWDEVQSRTVQIVAEELRQNWYALDRIHFGPEDVVIDIGAHVGLVSMYLARLRPWVRVHAFEPHPGSYTACVDNVQVNCIPNVQVNHCAVTGDGRPVVLHCRAMNTGGTTAIFDMPEAEVVTKVASVTLDSILDRVLLPWQRCRLLKIDCEGMEYEILRQCRNLHRIDYLVGEFHSGRLLTEESDGSVFDPETLFEDCAKVFTKRRMRIGFCRKEF